jgi:hypothetical protein
MNYEYIKINKQYNVIARVITRSNPEYRHCGLDPQSPATKNAFNKEIPAYAGMTALMVLDCFAPLAMTCESSHNLGQLRLKKINKPLKMN